MLALVALCVAAAIAALVWVGDASGSGASPSGVPDAEEAGRETGEEPDGLDEDAAEAIERARDLADVSIDESSAEAFLGDLEARGREARMSAGVRWTVASDLVEPAREVMRAYRELPDASLLSSGYLDLKGNVWSALIQGGSLWVDMVYVAADEAGDETEVRVVRFYATYAER